MSPKDYEIGVVHALAFAGALLLSLAILLRIVIWFKQ